ncbi:MAG: FAD-binding protein [Chitinophagaceae bacterium]|jgi:glycolate oxidase|nr:FAD-binding protein [Chitinophagaceae bacterium]MCF8288792.1 FAD-binding protein [Chitinophagaceae bacterium]MCF8421711.1 FAD-binding protein [Chitinophagaceae bacterium]
MQEITTEILAQIKSIVGAEYVFTDEESFEKYGRDETEKLHYSPAVVVKPRKAEEIGALMQLANKHLIPVTPRGAGTGLTGGALPHLGGLVIAMERFNSILEIDERNLQVTTEPGVITEVLQNAVKEKGLFYPPDPASKGSCFIGGNISENSGGPKAVKYGVVKDYVLNLEIVLPTGEIIWTGSNVLKNATGYNLTQLIVGSEGTLGIVTKIVLRLIPHPKFDLLMLAPFDSLEKASEAVSAIFRAGITPSAMELMEIESIKLASKLCESTAITITDNLAAHLIIEVDGNDKDVLMKDMEAIADVLTNFEVGELYFADDAQQKTELWKIRRKANEASVAAGYTIEEDTVVPRAELPKLIKGVKALAAENGFKVVSYGHAGDGNLHVRINHPLYKKSYENEVIQDILFKIFELVKSLGGTISGEHGIGLIQKSFMPVMFDPITMELMKGIKKVFDPNHILNAGKIFDSK